MGENDLDTRERILTRTLALLQSEKDFSKVTIRRLVSEAGVNQSAINYHFGSKKELIAAVVKKSILEFMAQNSGSVHTGEVNAVKLLKELAQLPARYLAENVNISRISILTDLTDPFGNDLTEQTMAFLTPAARAAYPGMTEQETGILVWGLVSMLQTAFLRNSRFQMMTGYDFFDANDRNRLVGVYIDNMAEGMKGKNNG